MSIRVQLTMLSGRSEEVEVTLDGTVNDLRRLAQVTFSLGVSKLMAKCGEPNERNSIAESLEDGDVVTIVARKLETFTTSSDVRLVWHSDGSLRVAGNPLLGGFHPSHIERLSQVEALAFTHGAVAAVCFDGSVLAWGHRSYGGTVPAVLHGENVRKVYSTAAAFAVICRDGSVVTWGHDQYGGDSRLVQEKLKDVAHICGTCAEGSDFEEGGAFAAILADGSVVSWGSPRNGGDSSALDGGDGGVVRSLQATQNAFAAVKQDGSVVTWGQKWAGGDSLSVQEELRDVRSIAASRYAFVALREDGRLVTCGSVEHSDQEAVRKLVDVKEVQASYDAFAALHHDGSVSTWGGRSSGGDSSAVKEQLVAVQELRVHESNRGFIAILGDGEVTWGPLSRHYVEDMDFDLFD